LGDQSSGEDALLLETVNINFDDPQVVREPRPAYEQIRSIGPVVFNDRLGVWMVVGYEECLTALHDPEHFGNHAYGGDSDAPDIIGGAKYMINEDAPEHIRLRNVARDAFLRRSLRQFEATIEKVVDDLLDGPQLTSWPAGQELEAMGAYARMVPAMVIALLLGVPTEDVPLFVGWSDALTAAMNSGQKGTEEWEQTVAAANDAGQKLRAYLRAQVEAHEAVKSDDLINDLLEANEHGDLAPDEMLATLILLLIAGNETTTKLIGVALKMLGESPELRARLIDNPDLVSPAIEEFLRFEGVTATIPRVVRQEVTLGGVDLKSGEMLLLMLSATSRDPRQFEHPDDFDIDRDPNQHLAFGHGVHFCLGNSLARMEARLAITGWLRRFPDFTTREYEFAPAFFARGLQTLTLVKS
jgi:cytochrome P450